MTKPALRVSEYPSLHPAKTIPTLSISPMEWVLISNRVSSTPYSQKLTNKWQAGNKEYGLHKTTTISAVILSAITDTFDPCDPAMKDIEL